VFDAGSGPLLAHHVYWALANECPLIRQDRKHRLSLKWRELKEGAVSDDTTFF
jgi:mRNA-degrading endonuclease YafQ of YafQ-DinJ toxin-antitoxin module